ncbi:unnamed protein product [Prunus armeniaca]|nr:unnamed protein product [Prunus armeniaca]
MHLKEHLTLLSRGTKPVYEYLQLLKSTTDELALIDVPITEDDLTIYALNDLRIDFKEISAAICARETAINFEELHDKFVDYEETLKRESTSSDTTQITENYT